MLKLGFVALAISACACPAFAQKGKDAKFIADAKNVVAEAFRDPDSVKFRNVGLYQKEDSDERYVCGQVNAKNLYGAYVGYKLFYATPTRAQIVTNQDGRLDSANYEENCFKKLSEVK